MAIPTPDHQLADIALCTVPLRAAIYVTSEDPLELTARVQAARAEIARIETWSLDRRHVYTDHGAAAPQMSRHTAATMQAAVERRAFDVVVVRGRDCLASDVMQRLVATRIRVWSYAAQGSIDEGEEP